MQNYNLYFFEIFGGMLAENLAKFQINFLDPSIERANLDFLHGFCSQFSRCEKNGNLANFELRTTSGAKFGATFA